MFTKKSPGSHLNDHDIRALLEQGCEFEGKLAFTGVVRLNGKFKGEIVTDDVLIIGPTAELEGHLSVGAVVIGGSVRGDVRAKQRVEILPTGSVAGQIWAPTLVTHEGAKITGNIEIFEVQQAVDLQETELAS